jgi:vitamin B12 transporter
MCGSALGLLAAAVPNAVLAQATSGAGKGGPPALIDEVIVTATARPESRSRFAGTINVIDTQKIEAAQAVSVTDLLAQNAIGFSSEWSPGQTQLNIRGGTTDGQGRDFKSQVLVLINGRRAGTANISKLSASDVQRIEAVRGPSSVIYGSQNMGGVVNLIMKTGHSFTGGAAEITGGSWGLIQGDAQYGVQLGKFDAYVGLSAGSRGDYHTGEGGGKEINTAWKRQGASAAAGYQVDDNNRLEFALRSDGIYDAGFRGSAASYASHEDRFNNSGDLVYTGKLPGGRLDWSEHLYDVRDVDDLKWAAPVVRGSNGQPAPGTSKDYDKRTLRILGSQFRPHAQLWTGNDILVGWDWERSVLRSSRFRQGVGGATLSQIAPLDNNQTDRFDALYFEDAQRLLDERITLRGGLRHTSGQTSLDPTPNLANAIFSTRPYKATTYSLGATFRATDQLVLRIGAASGFRAPNATELDANFITLNGGQNFGNANLRPETSHQVEIGGTYSVSGARLDLAIFHNVISDRIITRPRVGQVNVSDFINNPGDVSIKGVEAQADVDVGRLFGADLGGHYLSASANGYYNFEMRDKGASASANTSNVQRVYKYQGSASLRWGTQGGDHDWWVEAEGVLNGPVWYDTEELLLIPLGEPNSTFIHRVSPYGILNLRAEYRLSNLLSLTGGVNNVLNRNYHPLLIANDKAPYLLDPRFSNGGLGTSLPGREFRIGLRARF